MASDPPLFSGSRHCYIGKKTALLIMDIAQGIFNHLEGQDKVIPICLFILASERLSINVRENENIHDASFFTKDLASVEHICRLFDTFAQFSTLKINCGKSELCGIGSLKGVKRAFYGFKVPDLTHESIKILGCHHSYDVDLASSRNFFVLLDNIQAVLNLWRTRYLTLDGKTQVFKTLGLSKMQYLVMMSNVPNSVIEILKVIHNKFL